MMKDTDDPQDIFVVIVEDAMLPMVEATDRRVDFEPKRSRSRISFEKPEGLVETSETGFTGGLSESFDAIRKNIREIGPGRRAEPNLSHARRR